MRAGGTAKMAFAWLALTVLLIAAAVALSVWR